MIVRFSSSHTLRAAVAPYYLCFTSCFRRASLSQSKYIRPGDGENSYTAPKPTKHPKFKYEEQATAKVHTMDDPLEDLSINK
jgi:hypothetical protein